MTSLDLPGLSLRLEADCRADAVTLKYSVTNTGEQILFLLDGLHDPIGADRSFPMRKEPWVRLDADGVTAMARFLGPPAGSFVNMLNYPFPQRVLPGERGARTFVLPLPAVPATPYRAGPRPTRPRTRTVPLFFELGYFFGDAATERMARIVATSEGPRASFDALSERGQRIARVGPICQIASVVDADGG